MLDSLHRNLWQQGQVHIKTDVNWLAPEFDVDLRALACGAFVSKRQGAVTEKEVLTFFDSDYPASQLRKGQTLSERQKGSFKVSLLETEHYDDMMTYEFEPNEDPLMLTGVILAMVVSGAVSRPEGMDLAKAAFETYATTFEAFGKTVRSRFELFFPVNHERVEQILALENA